MAWTLIRRITSQFAHNIMKVHTGVTRTQTYIARMPLVSRVQATHLQILTQFDTLFERHSVLVSWEVITNASTRAHSFIFQHHVKVHLYQLVLTER